MGRLSREQRRRLDALDTVDDSTTRDDVRLGGDAAALVILWSADEPERIGEVARVTEPSVLGRGGGTPDQRRLRWRRQRPGRSAGGDVLAERRVSRTQLEVEPSGEGLRVRNVGRASLEVDGRKVDEATVQPGAVLRVKTLVLGVTRRPEVLPEPRVDLADVPWGGLDPDGLVGESPAAWELRDRLAFFSARPGHVLLLGASGAGKELAARALHRHGPASGRPLVSRNAATLPEGLVDAELFGNLEGYPNPGMRARAGLVGEADGSTLFLDEIGELPEAAQASLLRVLDRGGEYHRLGEARARRSSLRLIAATNRSPDALKHDLLARFRIRLEVPDLGARREDVPLLAVHLLRQAAADDPELTKLFFDERGWPRLDPRLVVRLVRHPYTHNVRELDQLLWMSIAESRDGELVAPEDLAEIRPEVDPADLSADDVAAALTASDGVLEATWRALGLRNRFQLIRLLKKHRLGRYA